MRRGRNPRLAIKATAHAYAVEARDALGRTTYRLHSEGGALTAADWQDIELRAKRAKDYAEALISLAEVMGRVETAGSGAIKIGDTRYELELIA